MKHLISTTYFLIILFPALISVSHGATLLWDGNSEDDLAGYKIHIITISGEYDSVVNVGKDTTAYDLSNFYLQEYEDEDNYTYYTYNISLTAYDTSGNESDPSDIDFFADDGVAYYEDNCPSIYNPDQEDSYPPGGNDCGDACECEGDFDGDGDVKDGDIADFKASMGRGPLYRPCSICVTGSSIPYPETNACQTDADCGVGGECGPDPTYPCYGDFDCDGDVKDEDIEAFKADMGRGPLYRPCPACSGVNCSY